MRKLTPLVFVTILFVVGVFIADCYGQGHGRVSPPPRYAFHSPPPAVVIPGTYVYKIPDIDADVLFY